MRPRALSVVVVVVAAVALPASGEDAPTSTRAPNLYGENGLVRTTSARTGNNEVSVGFQGFGFLSPDFVVPDAADANTYLGGHSTLSLSLFEIAQLSLAARAAASVDANAGTAASVGDLIPSLKLGYTLLPVAFGVDLRAFIPTREDAAGLQFTNSALTAQGLVTLDLKEKQGIPVRAHLNGGFTYQLGKNGDQKVFEQNPNFLDGAAGHLQALPTQQWFYDSAHVALGVEVPLPYAAPFLELSYETAVGVPDNRGASGKPYDLVGNAALIVTPGVRITPGLGFAIDLAVDVGPTGNGGGLNVDANNLVEGQPLNPLWMGHFGISHTFDPLGGGGGGGTSRAATGQLQGCVTDENGTPISGAIVEGPALQGARVATDAKGCFSTPPLAEGQIELSVTTPGFEPMQVAALIEEDKVATLEVKLKYSGGGGAGGGGGARVIGYVTNKDDEVMDADIEVTDARGARSAGKAAAGAFDVDVAPGRVWVVAKLDKYLATGAEVVVDSSSRARTTLVLKPLPKKKGAFLDKDKISTSARIPFDFKKPRLQSAAEYVLDEVVDILLRNPTLKVRVDAYAEPLNTPEEGQRLADDRAQAVVEYLAQHGVARARLQAKGVANMDEKSRRVELVLVP